MLKPNQKLRKTVLSSQLSKRKFPVQKMYFVHDQEMRVTYGSTTFFFLAVIVNTFFTFYIVQKCLQEIVILMYEIIAPIGSMRV